MINYDPVGPVFISYRRSDGHERAKMLDIFLRAGGLAPWRDLVDLPPGETARRVAETFEKGLSSAVLIITEEISDSQFIRNNELPQLLEGKHSKENFQLLVLNTITTAGGAIDLDAPDRLLNQESAALKDLKQYGDAELRQLYRDLLYARLKHLETTNGTGIGGHEIRIQTQTRPEPDANTQVSGTIEAERQHDLAIRLRQDETIGIPAEVGYVSLQYTLPILVDGLYAHGVSDVTLIGGGHYSLGWALGAALPNTRQNKLKVIDVEGKTWGDPSQELDGNTFQVSHKSLKRYDLQHSSDLPQIAVLIRNKKTVDQQAFDNMAHSLPNLIGIHEIVIKGESDVYPSSEGDRLAHQIATDLREVGSGKELHIAWSAATALAPLVGRQVNTLNCVLYELDQNRQQPKRQYRRVIRVAAGFPGGPIAEVFPQARPLGTEKPLKLINLTPHPVRLYRDDECVHEWPVEGKWVRVDEERSDKPSITHEGIQVPVQLVQEKPLKNLPDISPGTGYIVSRISAAASDRRDFFFPLSEVRDDQGNILGVKGLGQFPERTLDSQRLIDLMHGTKFQPTIE